MPQFAQAKIDLKSKVLETGLVNKHLHLKVLSIPTDELARPDFVRLSTHLLQFSVKIGPTQSFNYTMILLKAIKSMKNCLHFQKK